MKAHLKLKKPLLTAILSFYCILALLPFYILAVRSFTPTIDSTVFRLWIPERRPLSMNFTVGSLATNYSMDLKDFRQTMGIKGYLSPQTTLEQLIQQHNIPQQKIVDYVQPIYQYNGISTVMKKGVFTSLWGTILVAGASVLVGGFMGIMTGTGLSGFRQKWQLIVYNSYLLNMIIPPMMVILTQYLIMTRYLGLKDSYLAIILLNIKGGALSTMVFTSYIASIPKELRESVYLDGGNHLHYFLYILLPLMGTPFAVYASITMPWYWNDLLHGLVFLSPEKYTLPAFVASIGGTYTNNFEAIYSGVLVSLVPIMVVYIIFQKMFIRSAMSGALKG
jgi:ABC-type glycerol-3-phosphate transport system permease component